MFGGKKKAKKKPQTTWGKIWYFIWEDDSVLSWIVNIILAFILIKFIVYPGLGFLLATSHPIVAVVSGSMYHGTEHPCIGETMNGICIKTDKSVYEVCGNYYSNKKSKSFNSWWGECGPFYDEWGISKEKFKDFSLHNGFNKGDIIILRGSQPKDIEIGDIIVYVIPSRADPIIHRVINKANNDEIYIFTTKGDHNSAVGSFEKSIPENTVIGKAYFKIPYLGYVKILAVEFIQLFR